MLLQETPASGPCLPRRRNGLPNFLMPMRISPRTIRRRKESDSQSQKATGRSIPATLSRCSAIPHPVARGKQVQPRLAAISTSAIASRIGVSRWYAGRIRRGYRPHPRHWQALAQLVGVSANASIAWTVAASREERIVRNDEVVGSSPTSSTKFSYTCKPPVTQPCHTLSHKSGLARMVFASTLRRRTLAQKKRVILYSITALGFAEKPEGESCPLSRSMASKRSSTKRRKAEGGRQGRYPKLSLARSLGTRGAYSECCCLIPSGWPFSCDSAP